MPLVQVVLHASVQLREHEEASPNLPGVSAVISRPRAVTVRFLNAEGAEEDRDFVGLWATWLLRPIIGKATGLRVRGVAVIMLLGTGLIYSNQLASLAEEDLFPGTVVYSRTSPYQRIVVSNNREGFQLSGEDRRMILIQHTGSLAQLFVRADAPADLRK